MSYPDSNSDELRKLLGCKRYEQPPPGYFVSFSDRVIARIEAEEAHAYSSWWSWLLDRVDAKPVLVCAYGVAVSGLLVMGFSLSQVFDAELAATPSVGGPWLASTPASPILLSHGLGQNDFLNSSEASSLAPTKLVLRDEPNHLLILGSKPHFQPAGFAIGH